MGDDVYTRYKKLFEQYSTKRVKSRDGLIEKSIFTVAILLLSNHTTWLEEGAIKVQFVRNFFVTLKEETTPRQLLQQLARKTISVEKNRLGEDNIHYRAICNSAFVSSNPEIIKVVREFLADPMSFLPSDLVEQVREALRKKTKSINKRIRNYDSEKRRRDRGRRARAITALTKVLKDLDPEFRGLAVQALRHNHSFVGKHPSLYEFLNTITAMCSKNNLKNWQDEEVIVEAERLADIAWVMYQ